MLVTVAFRFKYESVSLFQKAFKLLTEFSQIYFIFVGIKINLDAYF